MVHEEQKYKKELSKHKRRVANQFYLYLALILLALVMVPVLGRLIGNLFSFSN